ncbi:MAG: hypothetical protein HY518_04330 [Candidatus Aenigmarchaeota archaeon]|nr:hypothetical protein [Candidatus Aenigmarchaeota archaeon]
MRISTRGIGYSAIATMVLITLLTIGGELSEPFKTSLASLTGHHWVSKGVLSLVAFAVLSAVLGAALKEEGNIRKTSYIVSASAIVLAAVIFGFFVFEFFA